MVEKYRFITDIFCGKCHLPMSKMESKGMDATTWEKWLCNKCRRTNLVRIEMR